MAKLFGVSRSLTYRWVKSETESLPEPKVSNEIKEIEFDEMWHLKKYGSSRRWIVAQGELLLGLLGIMMLQPSDDCKRLNM